jgi:hypothetical protein
MDEVRKRDREGSVPAVGVVTVPKLARQHLARLAEKLISGSDDLQDLKDMAASIALNPDLRKRVAFLIRDFCSDHMRPEIKKFSGLMELKLLKHDPARGEGWKSSGDSSHHLERISFIAAELEKAIEAGKRVGLKAADLANHAMMLADIAGDLEDV